MLHSIYNSSLRRCVEANTETAQRVLVNLYSIHLSISMHGELVLSQSSHVVWLLSVCCLYILVKLCLYWLCLWCFTLSIIHLCEGVWWSNLSSDSCAQRQLDVCSVNLYSIHLSISMHGELVLHSRVHVCLILSDRCTCRVDSEFEWTQKSWVTTSHLIYGFILAFARVRWSQS